MWITNFFLIFEWKTTYDMRNLRLFFILSLLVATQGFAQQAILSSGGDVSVAGYGSMSFSNAQLSIEQTAVATGRISHGVQVPVEIYGARLSGLLRYANTARTPMTNTRINLFANGQLVDTARTDASGAYRFNGVPQGSYQMSATTNKPWGGLGAVNSSDALILKRHFNFLTTLSGINFLAGDINQTSVINGTDALLIHRRYVGADNSFPFGDWAYDFSSTTQLSSGQELQTSNLALVYGDVNGTYTPDINLRQQWLPMDPQGSLLASGASFNWPLYVQQNYELGAVSLDLMLPEGLQVQSIEMGGEASSEDLIFLQEGQQVRIGWYSLEPLRLNAGETLMTLKVKGRGEGLLSMGKYGELADAWAVSYGDFLLSAPRLSSRGSVDAWQAIVHPNPSTSDANLTVNLPSPGLVKFSVTDIQGRLVHQAAQYFVSSGKHQLALSSSTWAEGQYHVLVEFGQEATSTTHHLKFNKIK
jgi:hypothetical protein